MQDSQGIHQNFSPFFCRDLMNVLKWNIYSCFKEAVMMQWNSTGEGRIEWHLNKMAQSRGRLKDGKNWASIIEVKIHGLDEKCEQSFISVLFRARRGSRPCTECQSLGEKIKFPPCIYFNWHDTSQIMPFFIQYQCSGQDHCSVAAYLQRE